MATRGDRIRFLAVVLAYAAAFLVFRMRMPSGVDTPWFVAVAMICFLGLAFVARPLISIRMARPLRRIRAWEAGGRLYARLGVKAFGTLLRRTPLRLLNRDVYLAGGPRSTSELLAQLEAAEASHFWAALLVVPYMVRLGVLAAWTALAWLTLAQLLINVYPIMHLRLTRARLERLASRKSSLAATTARAAGDRRRC